jgi:hypothetical protein
MAERMAGVLVEPLADSKEYSEVVKRADETVGN